MKIIRQLLGALLLLFFVIACNQETKKKSTDEGLSVTTVTLQEDAKNHTPQPPPPPKQMSTTDYSRMMIVPDGEVANIEVQNLEGIKDEGLVFETEEKIPAFGIKEFNTEDYDNIVENKFLTATKNPLSTFSIDVDEAAYSNVRRYLENGSLPPAGAVRIEEMINYFDYVYPKPQNGEPFTVNTEICYFTIWYNHHS